jgi:hypothetical protein
MLAQAAADEAAAALGVKRIDAVENLQCLGEQIDNIDSMYRANDASSSGRAESPDVTFQRPPAQVCAGGGGWGVAGAAACRLLPGALGPHCRG